VTPDRERGSTLPLVLVFFLIAASFVAVAVAATALHLERLRLLTVADGAALAAAESFRVADVHVQGDAVVPTLSAPAVAAAARRYLDDARPTAFDGLTLRRATTDGRSATVTLSSVWHPPIGNELLPLALPLEVTSTAAARFR
jgi:Tfp pilus assembly protein PilX